MFPSRLAIAVTFSAAASAWAGGDPCNPIMPGHVPDLDQVRASTMSGTVIGLPGDGYGYCAPTTTVGVMLYLANNGYPSLEPGPGGYLGGNAIYQAFTEHIRDMGDLMGTDEVTGTEFSEMASAISTRIAEAGLTGSIITALTFVTSDGAPSMDDLRAYTALEWPTIAAFGWYEPEVVGGTTEYTRTAGHVAIVRSVQNMCGAPGPRTLSLRDPATLQTYPYTQLPPATDTYPVFASANSFNIGGSSYSGVMEFVLGYSFDDSFAFIDGAWVFIPVFGLSPCCNGLSVGVVNPLPGGGVSSRTIAFPPGRAVLDGSMSARRHRFFAIIDRTSTSTSPTLWEADLSTGAATQVPTPVPPALVCTGRDPAQRYVMGEDGLIYTTIGTQVTVTTPPAEVMAMCFDNARNQLVCLSAVARRVFRFNGVTMALVSNQLLPSSVVLGDQPRITICPVGAYLWLAGGESGAGANRLYGLTGTTGSTLSLAATITDASMPETVGVDADDRGHVFTSSAGQIIEFAPPPTPTGAWTRVTSSRWAALRVAGPWFQIARSVSNFTSGIHEHRSFSRFEIPDRFTTSVPDCPPDVNGSGTLSVQDLFDFLALYFVGSPGTELEFAL